MTFRTLKQNKQFLLFLYFLEVRSCTHLQVLELERIPDLSLQVATELCRAGLKSLQTLILTHTPVSGQAILHFHGEIRSLLLPGLRLLTEG